MTRCLDEAKLQSYFDGELSIEMMESVTSHLAACVTCAAAAREVEQESALLMEALSADFDVSVPTERLRERVDLAVLGERVAVAQTTQESGSLAGFFSGLLNFGSQRTLGYASLAVVLAFASIMGVVMMKNSDEPASVASTQPATPKVEENTGKTNNPQSLQASSNDSKQIKAITPKPSQVAPQTAKNAPAKLLPKTAPVKLIPGERSYLQTIARLDSSINSNKQEMRPSLRAEYERNLAVVDRAIAATRTAVKSNPNDTDAADFMFAAYQSKVDLLNTIADARLGGRGH